MSENHSTHERPSALTIEDIKHECGITDGQLDQGIPRDALFDIARLIPNWYDYAGTPGMRLNKGDKLTISNNGWLTTNSLKAQRALELWYKENPYRATFRCIVSMCLQRGDGDIGVNIVKEVLLGQREDTDYPPPNLTGSEQQHYMTLVTAPIEAQSLFKHVDSQEKVGHRDTNEFDEVTLALKSRQLMKKEFGILYSSLRRALLEKNIEASDLISHLRDMEVFGPETEPIYTRQDVTLCTAISAMKIEPTLNDVFHLMAPYCSWFNHLLIESIIETYFPGDKDHYIHKKFVDFKKKFVEYCEHRWVCLDQENYGPDEVDGTTSAVFKIDQHWENIRLEQLRDITETLASALRIRSHNLLLRTVNNGCLELNLAMPTHLAEELFPIQGYLLPTLKDHKVLSYRYEEFSWTCDISKALEGINQSEEMLKQFETREDVSARLIASRLREIGERLDHSIQFDSRTPGVVTGLMLADVGEKVLSEFFIPPVETLFSEYGGPLVQWLCFLIPALIPLGTKYRVAFGITGTLFAFGIQYSRWQKYPHNLTVRRSIVRGVYGSLGMLTVTLPLTMLYQSNQLQQVV